MVAEGAYGFKMSIPGDLSGWLVQAPADWPQITLETLQEDPGELEEDEVFERFARFGQESGAVVTVAAEGTATWRSTDPIPADSMLHPGLALIAATFSRWRQEESFHAGAFVNDGRAWALCGDRGTGKSSLLAAVAHRGLPVLADDLVVLRGPKVMAGPRAIDLRGPSPHTQDRELVPARYGDRVRLRLPACPPEAPLAGWILLSWGDALSMRPVPPSERLQRLAQQRYWLLPTNAPTAFMDAAVLPMFELTRPHGWDVIDATLDALLSH